ncbi:MAG: phenylalanine--tRNA ligase subunit alpha, partial [Candidatus Marinimicrobia bacterium]|nr:phenylalanine--tRNA ligase subunit alpha [Candidatus Neomarinimicrobiota bacterium]
MIKDTILEVQKQFKEALANAKDNLALEEIKNTFLGRKGKVAALFSLMGEIPAEERKDVGQMLNKLKIDLQSNFDAKVSEFTSSTSKKEWVDYTLPGYSMPKGSRHPLTQAVDDMLSIFQRLGFDIAYGPEVETD